MSISKASATHHIFALYHNKSFVKFAIGNLSSLSSAWLRRFTTTWLMWEATGSTWWLGILAFVELFPMAVVAPLTGRFCHKFGNVNILLIAQITLAINSVVILLAYRENLLDPRNLLIVTFISSLISGVELQSILLFVNDTVNRENLPSAIAINSLSFNLSKMIGPGLFGPLALVFGVASIFAVNVAAHISFSILLISIKSRPYKIITDNKEKYIKIEFLIIHKKSINKSVANLLLLMFFICLFVHPIFQFLPMISDSLIDVENNTSPLFAFSLLGILMGTGAIFGSIILLRLWIIASPAAIIGTSALLSGACLLLFTISPFDWMILIVLGILSGLIVVHAAGTQTCLQLLTNEANRGKVLSYYVVVLRSGPAIGTLLFGLLSTYVTPDILLIGDAIIFLAISWPLILQFRSTSYSLLQKNT